MLLKYIYTLFLGLLLATFVGVGISAFYQAPKPPEYPTRLERLTPAPDTTGETAEQQQLREQFEAEQKAFQEMSEQYHRNVSLIALGFAIAMVVVSLLLPSHTATISDGVLLGGVLTLLYSIGHGFASNDNMYRFVLVTVGLAVALILGYLKFIAPSEKSKSHE